LHHQQLATPQRHACHPFPFLNPLASSGGHGDTPGVCRNQESTPRSCRAAERVGVLGERVQTGMRGCPGIGSAPCRAAPRHGAQLKPVCMINGRGDTVTKVAPGMGEIGADAVPYLSGWGHKQSTRASQRLPENDSDLLVRPYAPLPRGWDGRPVEDASIGLELAGRL
jgi:hypothetical protein